MNRSRRQSLSKLKSRKTATDPQKMEKKPNSTDKKTVKQERNLKIKESTPETSMKPKPGAKEDRLRGLFVKVEEMNRLAKTKNDEIESQFSELRLKLNSSSNFLSNIKQSIDNIKCSYQKSIEELERVHEDSRADVEQRIEEIRLNIDKVKSRRELAPPTTYRDYQEALTGALSGLEDATKITNCTD